MIHFEHPAMLIALAVVPPLGYLWWRTVKRVDRAAADSTGRTQHAANVRRGAARLAALCCLIVGLAGPCVVGGGAALPHTVPTVFVLDVSASMAAQDVVPDRITQGREAIERICDLLPGTRTALVAGAEDAAVVCPLTADRAAFLSILRQARAGWMSGYGTRIERGLDLAVQMLDRENCPGAIVLVSDGEDPGGVPERALTKLRKSGNVLHTLVVGTTQGVPVSELPIARGTEETGERTRARPQRMAEWAAAGGGAAWQADAQDASLPRQREEIVPAGQVMRAATDRGAALRLSTWCYLSAALLMLLDGLIPFDRRRPAER
jgi:hypothetical protein